MIAARHALAERAAARMRRGRSPLAALHGEFVSSSLHTVATAFLIQMWLLSFSREPCHSMVSRIGADLNGSLWIASGSHSAHRAGAQWTILDQKDKGP